MWPCVDMMGMFHTVSLQSRNGAKCHSKEHFSPKIEIEFEKLALNVLAHIQSLANATQQSHAGAERGSDARRRL